MSTQQRTELDLIHLQDPIRMRTATGAQIALCGFTWIPEKRNEPITLHALKEVFSMPMCSGCEVVAAAVFMAGGGFDD